LKLSGPVEVRDARLKRLAEKINALADKDAGTMRRTREIAALRRNAAADLHRICCEFVDAVNALLPEVAVVLDPTSLAEDWFDDEAVNLIQINVRGRILQVELRATPELVSTEEFRVPYTIQGFVRAFNQQMLDKDLIEEQLIFFTLEKERNLWRFFDPRTYRSGPFDQEYLISLMEQLI
jgi:hypothetical protein